MATSREQWIGTLRETKQGLTDKNTAFGRLGMEMMRRAFRAHRLMDDELPAGPNESECELMKIRANTLAKYYYKGFADYLNEITSGCDLLLKMPDQLSKQRRGEIKADLIASMDVVIGKYRLIPFESLEGDSINNPLFFAKEALDDMANKLNNFLGNEKQETEEYARIEMLKRSIIQFGLIVRCQLELLLEKINDTEPFGVTIMGMDGKFKGNYSGDI